MDLDKTVEVAYAHFCEHHGFDSFARNLLFLHFATDELQLSEDVAKQFVGSMTCEPGKKYGQDFTRFCLWYYVNYVVDHISEDC